MSLQTIMFDLDGTLIDSSPSILQSFAKAFEQCDINPVKPLSAELIGPPLMLTLRLLSGSDDEALIARLALAFKTEYDRHAYQHTQVFEGVTEMLQALQQAGLQLYIATNKRILPTQRIIQHLGWESYFKSVYALDYFNPPLINKAQMVRQILVQNQLTVKRTLFVGDRREDGEAASVNQLAFALVSWGYLEDSLSELPTTWLKCSTPQTLTHNILNWQAIS